MNKIYPSILQIIQGMNVDVIPEERKKVLFAIVEDLNARLQNGGDVKINFICTHNSRRSMFSQVWTHVLTNYYQLNQIKSFSGGTEVTAVYPGVIETFKAQHFQVESSNNGPNPEYSLTIGEGLQPLSLTSKLWDDDSNPKENFVAVMTCTDADENCPFLPGCDARLSLPFVDPKYSDGTEDAPKVYRDTSLNIGTELKFIFGALSMFQLMNS